MRRASISTEAAATDGLLDRLCSLDAQVIYFPVRHHSPACALLLGKLIQSRKPSAVLIEGPSDFNPFLDELFLPHQLPVAIYSYCCDPAGRRHGAFYPFCEYSPEWSALMAAREVDAKTQFIDLPWAEVAGLDDAEHRYADGNLRYARYVAHLCERFGVDTFDDLWDKLIEADLALNLAEFLVRAHSFCYHAREWEEEIRGSDRRREAFMAERIRSEAGATEGTIIVVTGGFHSSALAARNEGFECVGTEDTTEADARVETDDAGRGITLTPYTYQRLDNLAGYNAGMPSPGFYSHVWRVRQGDSVDAAEIMRPLLNRIVEVLRAKKQVVSTADVIAVETTARSLANLRGRGCVWRADLVDAVRASLIKDESAYDVGSPFLDAVLEVMRGDQQGRLADGARRPPLVQEILADLQRLDLEPTQRIKDLEINLLEAGDLEKSRLLHSLRLLGIAGYRYERGPDFLDRSDLATLSESWRVFWSPEFDATCAEAARYGTSRRDAVSTRLTERADIDPPSATQAAKILVDAAFAGVDVISETLLDQLDELIEQDGDFLSVSAALDHLLYLYCFDEALQTVGAERIGILLKNAFLRAIWLLESLGQVAGNERDLVDGLEAISDTFRRSQSGLDLDHGEFVAILRRVARDSGQLPVVRGAVVGILWTLDEAEPEQVVQQMQALSSPEQLGDYLCGVFALARETAQRHPQLVRSVDDVIVGFDGDEFQEALPSLRLAFTYFAPREKHYMLSTLFDSLKLKGAQPLAGLEVDEATAAAALALEARVIGAITKYGLRGGGNGK